MNKNPNQPQTDDAVLDGQLPSSLSLSQCPICQAEYNQGEVSHCSVCNWDLTPCPEAFVERQNVHIAWAKEIWVRLQTLEAPLPTKINVEIDANPQLSEIRAESNSEIWELLITWICGIDLNAANTGVRKLQERYQGKEPHQIAHILIVQKSFQVAGVELVKGIGVAQLLDGLAGVDFPIIATLAAEMVYQIAAIYGLDLQAPERKLEVLAAFGTAFLGEQAFSAGINWMKYGLTTGMLMSAGAKGLMIYALGNTARLFYEAKVNQSIEPLMSSEAFNKLRQESQSYLEYTNSEETIVNIIYSEIEAAPIIVPPPKPVKKPKKGHHFQAMRQRNSDDKYKRLRNLLIARNWKEADRETTNKICELMGTYLGGTLEEQNIINLSSKDLYSINKLWLKYSKGRFGFSVQKQIYNTMRIEYEYRTKENTSWFSRLLGDDMQRVFLDKTDRLCDCLGWPRIITNYLTYEFKYSLSAPKGHLPSFTKYAQIKLQFDAFFNSIAMISL